MKYLLALPALVLLAVCPSAAAELKIVLPLARTAYQTNERIELSVVRSDRAALPAGKLSLSLAGPDGDRLSFVFAVKKVEPQGGEARAVEHFYVNGWLLRPGLYTAEVSSDGARAVQSFEVYSHVRRSSFRLVNWGRAQGKAQQLPQGEENLGFNLFYGHYGQDTDADFIRAGVDFMSNCTMSGAHQMDLRMECDWSDPLVIRGGTRRVARRAFLDRRRPNVPGVHFYDEPGLTWHKHPATGEYTPQGIPSQVQSYEAAFGKAPLAYNQVDPANPEHVRLWAHWARWKLGFMDAAWQDAQFGVQAVRPDYLSVTQSQYGWSAFTDGYYFNVVRSLPVISGHGGYHDFGPGYFNPSYFLEMARARDLDRPNWYLPCWYGNTTPDEFRLEQYLSFQTGIQGMISPPDLEPGEPGKSKAAAGIVASNHLMGRLGTIFTTMPPTRPPVAMLYSLSQMIHDQTLDRKISYAHETRHGKNLVFTYLAGKLIQQPFLTVLDEDVRDGTLAAHHKAVVLTSLDYLDPLVVEGLEAFVNQGGLVLATGDCKVRVKGAVNLGVVPQYPDAGKIAALEKAKKQQEAGQLMRLRFGLAGARPLADAIRTQLDKAGIRPVLASDEPGISATRQASGDVEYLFAVNASHDPQGDPQLGLRAVTATLGLPGDGRPVYDAVHGGPVPELGAGAGRLEGKFRFGPGQMRVFARTTRPIGGVKLGTAVLQRDWTRTQEPIRLHIRATVLDSQGGLLAGSIPLRIRLLDGHGPAARVRYDLYRATDGGTLMLTLPLGVNDRAGAWTVVVTELLNNTRQERTIEVPATATCAAVAGSARRALHLADDRGHVYRFFRTHHEVTIVTGAGAYDAAAQRLVKILKPWDVQAKVVPASAVNRPRSLSAEEARTWVGLNPGQAKPGDKNDPALVGYAIRGPVVLLGTPEDNPLIRALLDWHFLPYAPRKGELPGPGRGLVAWQRDGLGAMQESITLIAHDAEGMSEAVGSLYEMLAGMEPLTPWALPQSNTITPTGKGNGGIAELAAAWSVVLPDAVVAVAAQQGKLTALTEAGVRATVGTDGKVTSQETVDGPGYQEAARALAQPVAPAELAAAQKRARPGQIAKLARTGKGLTAVAYWGGHVELFDSTGQRLGAYRSPQDVTAMAWVGDHLVVGDADGRLVALQRR